MVSDKEKLKSTGQEDELREVKEKKPTESLVDSIAGILTSILKVRDLQGAQAVLQEAQRLKDEGASDRARDLALVVFEQLKKIGESEEVPEKAQLLSMASQGEYGKMAKLVEKGKNEIQIQDQNDKWKMVTDRAELAQNDLKELEVRKLNLARPLKKDEKAEERVAVGKQLAREAADKVKTRAVELAEAQAELNQRVMDDVERLFQRLDVEKGLEKKKHLEKQYKNLMNEMALSNRAELSLLDVQTTRARLGNLWREMTQDDGELVNKIKRRALEEDKITDRKIKFSRDVLAKIVGDKASRAVISDRTKELAGVLAIFEDKLKLGLPFDQICRELTLKQVRPIQQWLASIRKPGVDVVLDELTQGLLKDPEAFGLLQRFLKNIDDGYFAQLEEGAARQMREQGLNVPLPEMGGYRHAYEQPMDIDPITGLPNFGRSRGETDFDPSGVEFLKQQWDTPWIMQLLAAKTQEERDMAYKMQRVAYRQEMMNVNFEALAEDVPELTNLLDLEAIEEGRPVRLKEPNNAEHRKRLQQLWIQQMLFEQRLIAYEGVFGGAHQDARITRHNTLMQIMDVGTELKGLARFHSQMFQMVDKQQNSFLNEDALGEMVNIWVGQGPDFRLEDMLKEYRENLYVMNDRGDRVKIGDISIYDVLHKLRSEVTAEDKVKFNAFYAKAGDDQMSENMSRHYGTLMLRRTESDKRTGDRKLVFFSLMKDMGVDTDGLQDHQREWLYGKYQSYLDAGVNYLWTHKELHQAVGNASFKANKYELPQGLPEMIYKSDHKLCMDYFRIYSVGGASKDAFVVGDSGMRDDKTMAPRDFANHLLYPETTTQGAPGIREAFFGGKRSARDVQGRFIGRPEEDYDRFAEQFRKMMEKAIFHHGFFDKSDMVSLSTKIGDESNLLSGTRRSDSMTIKELGKFRPSNEFVMAIEWGTTDSPGVFAKIVKNPRLVKILTSEKLTVGGKEITDKTQLARLKWEAFVGMYGDDYYSTTAANAKRMDHFTKYGLKSHFQWYTAELAWQLMPINDTKAVEAMQPAQAVNAAIVPALTHNYMKHAVWSNERIGQRWIGGGKTKRVAKDIENKIMWRTDVGMFGKGDSEWPRMASEDLTNPAFTLFGPIISKTSVNDASNVGSYEDEQAIKNLAESFQRAGMLSEGDYTKYVKEHVIKSFFWSKKESPVVNLWKLITLQAAFDYMGSMWFKIPGFQLREAWGEATKERVKKLWEYFKA